VRVLDRPRLERLRRDVRRGPRPTHVGLVMDGNRRWARAAGLDARIGHRVGAEHVEDVLRWCEDAGIGHLTVYVLSADNIRRRGGDVDDITRRLGGGPVKDIDLVIRTSGETRLSGFFPWQCAGAELYLSALMWPAFGEADFLRALRTYAERRRRSGQSASTTPAHD